MDSSYPITLEPSSSFEGCFHKRICVYLELDQLMKHGRERYDTNEYESPSWLRGEHPHPLKAIEDLKGKM